MYTRNRFALGMLLTLGTIIQLIAQVASTQTTPVGANQTITVVVKDTSTPLTIALKLRNEAAISIANGSTKIADAIVKLKASASPFGLNLDADADLAGAVIDIGQRLVTMGKAVEAEQLFQLAETSLTAVIGRTLDSNPRDKAQYLGQRAFIRAKFLNEVFLAKTDLDAAQKLEPDDAYLPLLRNQLAAENAAIFSGTPSN